MNAIAVIDFSPPESSDRRFIDLPAGVISISTPRSSSGSPSSLAASASAAASSAARWAPSSPGSAPPSTARGPLSSRTRRSRPRPPGKSCAASSSKLLRGGLEGLLEGVADLAVGVADQRTQLAQRRLEVDAVRLELIDVGDRLRVLLLRPAG